MFDDTKKCLGISHTFVNPLHPKKHQDKLLTYQIGAVTVSEANVQICILLYSIVSLCMAM